jgi:hypothetical protein
MQQPTHCCQGIESQDSLVLKQEDRKDLYKFQTLFVMIGLFAGSGWWD